MIIAVLTTPQRGQEVFQPFLRFWAARQSSGVEDEGAEPVSTLLEILGLVWLVVVGF
jgi:hypothetical protein